LFFVAWAFYRVFLTGVSDERHRNLSRKFSSLLRHYMIFTVLFFCALVAKNSFSTEIDTVLEKAFPYLALVTLFWGFMVFVKTCSLILLQYLFLGSMKHGVPVLIVHIFSLLLIIIISLWVASSVFNVKLAPLLATSAIVSVVLGLALQDTLGNLFAGISLQIDKSFEIGDWLEITNGPSKTIGQVKEISWRATTVVGWSDELIIVPNRTLAASQIANFSLFGKPIIKSLFFRLPYGANVIEAKKVLVQCLNDIEDVKKYPEPLCLVMDTTDSWQALKLIFYIDNYGNHYIIGDRVYDKGHEALSKAGFNMAHQVIQLNQSQQTL
jgi:small-conductance mechanosensitive channel